jgi:hypothetical protein
MILVNCILHINTFFDKNLGVAPDYKYAAPAGLEYDIVYLSGNLSCLEILIQTQTITLQ